MAEMRLIVEARLRRGAMPLLFAVNVVRHLAGLSIWVPAWLVVAKVKPYAP